MIIQEYLKSILFYNKITGEFQWKISKSKIIIPGQIAGTIYKDGYRYITIDKKRYKAHRLAWFYEKGEWSKKDIDHENRIRGDNRWENLREASDKDQRGNTNLFRNNKSGIRGVYWNKRDGNWVASIRKNYKLKHLGGFTTKEEAKAVYDKAAKEYFGEFFSG